MEKESRSESGVNYRHEYRLMQSATVSNLCCSLYDVLHQTSSVFLSAVLVGIPHTGSPRSELPVFLVLLARYKESSLTRLFFMSSCMEMIKLCSA